MKVTDLMIGDWIEDGYKKAQVTSITCDGIVETTSAISNIEVVDPIPLTDEILTKNGWFALDEYRYEGDVALAKESSGFRLKNTNICVNYVHQLQHLLRLSGIEKEIEL